MSDDEDASKSNLVCNGQTQQWQASGVEWTKEGVKFDGTSSKMTLENVNFGNANLGFTWLLRLKRTPLQDREFLTNYDNSDTDIKLGCHLSEHQAVGNLHFATAHQFNAKKQLFLYAKLPNDANKFVKLGIACQPSENVYKMFYESGFLAPNAAYNLPSYTYIPGSYHSFSLGSRFGTEAFTDGTIHILGIANSIMSEAEINQFFNLVIN
jgi:hypothetical protein